MTEPLARLHVERRPDGPTVVTVSGEIDLTNADQLDRCLDDAAEQARDLVVDLSGVTYLDSQGLRVLLGLVERHQVAGLRLTVVCGRRGVVRDLLLLTRLGDVVTVRELSP